MKAVLLCLVATLCCLACGSPSQPTQAALSVVVGPNPIAGPSASANLVYSLRFQETAGVGVRLDREEIDINDGAGNTGIRMTAGLSQSAGCSTCTSDVRVAADSGLNRGTFTQPWILDSAHPPLIVQAPDKPVVFVYTIWYTDDRGHASSTSVTIPIV